MNKWGFVLFISLSRILLSLNSNADNFQTTSQANNRENILRTIGALEQTGKLSIALMTPAESFPFTYKGNEVFAIASTFKLYILGALQQGVAQGILRWDEVIPLREEWKSLPTGIMQNWPAGKKIEIQEYAEKMISISDNTATDHLLHFLGRDKVEEMLPQMGNAHEKKYFPVPATLELFKLKWAVRPDDVQTYLHSDVETRELLLKQLQQVPKSAIGTNGVPLNKPTLIDLLEWFATTPENCRAMFWLASRNDPIVRSILSKNVPALKNAGTTESRWSYAGYKGGSEPGVINMTYLLESKTGNRACLALSWNSPVNSLSEIKLINFAEMLLKFAEQKVP